MLPSVKKSLTKLVVIATIVAGTVLAVPSKAEAALYCYDLDETWVTCYSTGSSAGSYMFHYNKVTGRYDY